MATGIDLSGRTFGRWIVLEEAERRGPGGHRRYWLCRCECGSEREVFHGSLQSGASQSCGCRPPKDILGQQFGLWTVLREDPSFVSKVICKCDCGVVRSVLRSTLTSGKSKSCGCRGSFLVEGERYGKLVVTGRADGPGWHCICDCGRLRTHHAHRLRRGLVTSCGECWKDERYIRDDGYVMVYMPNHPRSRRNNGRVLEHIVVMEEKLGRPLLPGENVHHINGVRDDNRPENLELWDTNQPAGQRVEDKLAWALEFIERHAPDRLAA